jgi:SAM-dependent methyltransferase
MVDPDRRWAGSMPEAYERLLVPPVFRPFAIDLAQRVVARSPRRVLELAAGTGVLTRELVAAGVDVVATDLNQAMVDAGRRNVPGARWEQADGGALAFPEASFDVVACQFGVMFLADRAGAFGGVRRVLADGGAFLASTWAGLERHGFQRALVQALRAALPDDPPTFVGAVPHAYRDPDVVAADLRAAGFADVTVTAVTLRGEAPSAASLAAGYCTGTPLRAQLADRGDVDALTASVARHLEAILGDGPVAAEMTAYVAEAVTPPGPSPTPS